MDWLLEQLTKGWPLIKQAPLLFFIIFAISLALAFLLVRWLYRDHLARKDEIISDLQKKLALAPTTSKAESPDKWLLDIAEEYRQHINKTVIIEQYKAGAFKLDGSTPYLRFEFLIRNYSIFPITIDTTKVGGRIWYGSRPLKGEVTISNEYRWGKLERGYCNYIPLCQMLTEEDAEFINRDSGSCFRFDELVITITGTDTSHGVTPRPLLFHEKMDKSGHLA